MKASQNDEVVISVAEKLLLVLIDRAKRDAWIERLRSVEELDVNHAETELHLLELFAIQTAISTGPTQELRNLAAVIFKQLISFAADVWHWREDELVEILNNRIESYSRLNESPVGCDAKDMVAAVGIGYAMISHDRYSVRDEKGQMDADRFATVLAELLLDKSNVLTSVGRDVFRDRIESTEKVLRQIDKNPVVDPKVAAWLKKGTLAPDFRGPKIASGPS